MGKKTKIVGIILGVILVALIASVLTLWVMFSPEKLKALIIPQVEKALGRDVTLEKASLSFFPVIGVNLSGSRFPTPSERVSQMTLLYKWITLWFRYRFLR